MPVLLTLCSLLLSPVCTGAEQWEPIAIAPDHSAWLFIDRVSVKYSRDLATTRIMVEYEDDQPGIAETHYLPFVIVRSLVRMDCAQRRIQTLEAEYLDSADTFLGGRDVAKGSWEPLVSGSLNESAFIVVCKRGKPFNLTHDAGDQEELRKGT
jgi:hypothetical protein